MNRRSFLRVLSVAPVAVVVAAQAAPIPPIISDVGVLPSAPCGYKPHTVLVTITCGDEKSFERLQTPKFKAAILRMIEQARGCL